jgi:HAD superfamily hydrolase (TIGR01509 family)
VTQPASAYPASVTLPAAVLWDMDGTLVDTEPFWMAAEHDLVREFGGTWTDKDGQSLVGNPLLTSARVIRERGGVDLPDEVIVDRLIEAVTLIVRNGRVPWQPGAHELLTELNALGVPCALVTMSYSGLAEAVVEMLPRGSFDVLVTGDMVTHGKPHPESYLTAAARLGVRPADCIALEDSPPGLASAQAAGCRVVGIPHIVALEPGPGLTIIPTLAGIDVEALTALAPT